MSVAGILASNFFANALSQSGQKPASGSTPQSGAQSFLNDLEQGLSANSSSGTQGNTAAGSIQSITSAVTQLGQDIQSGNLSSAKTDLGTVRSALGSLGIGTTNIPTFSTGSQATQNATSSLLGSGATGDPLATAWQAYSALQPTTANNALQSSLRASTFATMA